MNFWKTIGLNTVIQIIGKVISVLLSILNIALLTRYLGENGYGQFSLIIAYLGTFSVLADLGFQLTVVRHLASTNVNRDQILGSFFYLKSSLVFLYIFFSLFTLLFLPYSYEVKIGIIIASFGIGLGNLNSFYASILQADLRLDLVTIADTVGKIVTTICIMVFVEMSLGLYAIVNTILIGNISSYLLTVYYLRNQLRFHRFFNLTIAFSLLKSTLPVGLILLYTTLYVKIDSFILSIFRPVEEVGFYSLAYKILENILLIWGFYMASVYPLFASFQSINKKGLYSLLFKSLLIGVVLSVIVVKLTHVFALDIITLLSGENFASSARALKILIYTLPFLVIDNVLYHYFISTSKLKILLTTLPIALAFNIIINLLTIPNNGFVAASVNTVLTELLICCIFIGFLMKQK